MTSASSEGQRDSRPVEPLDSVFGRVWTHLHPLFALTAYFLQFKAVVVDPVSTFSSMLLPCFLSQIFYTVACLPPVGGPVPPKSNATKAAGGKKKNAEAPITKRITTAVLSSILTGLLGAPLITIILILFGAPLTDHLPHTILCATHIAYLAIMPLIYAHGVDKESWRRIAALMLPMDEVLGAAIGTFLGAWIGAVPIPLDWDRDWQQWPITIVTGAYIGWAVGKFTGRYLFFGKTLSLSA